MSSSTTFSLETIDGGSNSQAGARAGDEAVCIFRPNIPETIQLIIPTEP